MGKRAVLMGAMSVVGLAALAQPAFAQEAEGEEEIVVIAQRREQALFDVPQATQALSAQQLEAAGASTLTDVVRFIPSASVVSAVTPGFETIQIRGVSAGTTGDGLVGYYIDDVAFGIPNLQLTPPASLLDVTRVEVVRGPQGTLFGQGSMGGTIRIVTAAPDSQDFSGLVRASGSTTEDGGDNYALDGSVNIPIQSDRLAIRVSGGVESLGGYAESPDFPGEEDINGFESRNFRVRGLLTPTDRISIGLSYWTIQNEQDFSYNLSTSVPGPVITGTGGLRAFTNSSADIFALTYQQEFDSFAFKSATSYIEHELDFLAPLLAVVVNDSTFETESFTQELQLNSTGEGTWNWILGAYYRDATITSDIDFTLLGASIIDQVGPLHTKSWSAFGEVSLDLFGGALVPLVGLRYFHDEREGRSLIRSSDLLGTPPGTIDAGEESWNSLNPRFNLTWRPAEDAILYFNAAKGFRSGTLQTADQAFAANFFSGIPSTTVVEPDSLWTYEIGGRLRSADGDWTIEGGLYHTDWSDIQLLFAAGGLVPAVVNGGEATIEGADIGLAWRPTQGITLQASAAVVNAEFDQVPAAVTLALPAAANGAALPGVPESNYTLSVSYDRPLGAVQGANLVMYGAYTHRAEQIDLTTNLTSDDLQDLTVRAGLRFDNWEFSVFALNALNEDSAAVLTTSRQILYPRRIGVQIGVNF